MSNFNNYDFKRIVQGCEEEARRRREDEVGFCFELFRRAVELRDNLAWDALSQQYNGLIGYWITRTSGTLSGEDKEDLMQKTWLNFYGALRKYKVSLADHFEHVGALLNYLSKCAKMAAIKHRQRQKKRAQLEEELAKVLPRPDWDILDRIDKQERVEAVKTWRERCVTTPQERLVFVCSFEQGLTPREIAKHHPDIFSDGRAASRVKENIIKRAKRYFS